MQYGSSLICQNEQEGTGLEKLGPIIGISAGYGCCRVEITLLGEMIHENLMRGVRKAGHK